MSRFTLTAGRWYAAEFVGDDFVGREGSVSPIKVLVLTPKGGGKRRFELEFNHLYCPEGDQNKRWLMETVERGQKFILARSLEPCSGAILKVTDICPDVAELGDAWRTSRRQLAAIADEIDPSLGDYSSTYKGAYLSLENIGLDCRPFIDHLFDIIGIFEGITSALQSMRDAPLAINGHESPKSFETYPPIYESLLSRIGEAFVIFETLSEPLIDLAKTEQGDRLNRETETLKRELGEVWALVVSAQWQMKTYAWRLRLEASLKAGKNEPT